MNDAIYTRLSLKVIRFFYIGYMRKRTEEKLKSFSTFLLYNKFPSTHLWTEGLGGKVMSGTDSADILAPGCC